jgi:hypothetical protein
MGVEQVVLREQVGAQVQRRDLVHMPYGIERLYQVRFLFIAFFTRIKGHTSRKES